MASPATVSEYGKYIDLQAYDASAPDASGSIYLSGAAGSELVRTNVGLSAAGNVTAVGSFIIGSADMDETDLEKLDGITNGTAAASKALVLDANKDIAGIRHLDLDGDLTAATVTMTGFTVDADGDVALKSLAVDDGSTIGCDSDTDLMSLADGALTVNGTLSADTSFTLDAVTVDATELGYLDGVTAGTAASSKALVLDANGAVGTITHLTATYAQIDVLDVNEINSVTRTETTLEVVDKLILAASGSNAANSDAGGLQIGGSGGSDTVASVLYDNANSALDFNIGGTTQVRLADGVLRPETDDDVDLGASGAEFKDLYLDGVAYVDELRADTLGAALDANSQAITNVNIDSGYIDGAVIGANSAASGTFTVVSGSGAATFASLTSDSVDLNGGAIDGTVIGANSAAAGTFTSLAATSLDMQGGDVSDAGDVNVDSISAAATDMDFLLTDNSATALEIKEGSNNYMVFDTSNGAEAIYVYKEMEVQAGAVVYDDQEVQFATDDSGAGASGSLSYVSADDVFQISGSAANGLKLVGDINASGFAFQAAAGTLTSLSVSDGNITNVGDIALDSISADDTDMDFSLTDNSATALEIKEGSNNYMVFDTTNGSELIDVYKEMEFRAGALVNDDQTMTFGTDDDSSIQFVSAANTLKLTGGSSGIHLASATALGADGGGVNLTVYGGSANEQMVYTAADHTLKFVDASSATFLTMGGDAAGEYAVDVADGSNAKNKIRAAAFVTYSDERLKTDVAPIEGGLNTVNSLRAVNFTWKKDGSRDFGFMAQELKRVVPQAVHGTDEGLYGVDYGRLSAILVSAIQEQSAQIASLKKQLENK